MPNDSTPVERLNQLAKEAQSFFEQVRGEPTNAWRLSEWTWGRLSREQQAIADRLGHDLRQPMALLVPAIPNAPLLDKRDLARFSRLGRTMDAALRFQHFARGGRAIPERAASSSAHTTRFAGSWSSCHCKGISSFRWWTDHLIDSEETTATPSSRSNRSR
jgi:hypothetical protein